MFSPVPPRSNKTVAIHGRTWVVYGRKSRDCVHKRPMYCHRSVRPGLMSDMIVSWRISNCHLANYAELPYKWTVISADA